MVLFPGLPYPISIIYLKIAGSTDLVSIPFCEALDMLTNIEFDYEKTKEETQKEGTQHYVFSGDDAQGKTQIYIVTQREMIQHLEKGIYANKYKIADMAVQPVDELIVEEVKKLTGI